MTRHAIEEESTPAARGLHGEGIFLSLFVACYNEQDNIIGTLETLTEALRQTVPSHEIIIIDDASRDLSVDRIRAFMESRPEVPLRLLCNPHNLGVAMNYAEGAFRARGEWYRMICGDNVEPVDTLVTIFRGIGSADIIVPYTVEIRGRGMGRKILSKLFTFIVNTISGYRMPYYNGLIVARTQDVRRWHSDSHGFGFQADLLTRLLSLGMTHREVAVFGNERATGESKALTFRNFCSVAHSLLNIAIRRVSRILYGRC